MSPILRIEMLLLAVVIVFIIVRAVNRKRIRVQYSLVWFLVSFLLLLVAVFPGIVTFLCRITGVQTPINLVFLAGIILLLLIVFYQTCILSRQSEQIKQLVQQLSVEKFRNEERTHEQ